MSDQAVHSSQLLLQILAHQIIFQTSLYKLKGLGDDNERYVLEYQLRNTRDALFTFVLLTPDVIISTDLIFQIHSF